MLTGPSGLLTQAQEAKLKTEEAEIEEQRKLAMLEATTNLENKPYIDKNGDKAIIPAGFAVTGIEGENVIEDGLVITDSEGNEFVWIPVTDPDSYIRHPDFPKNFTGNITDDTEYLPDGIEVEEGQEFEKEKELVTNEKVKGFYISRYEAGDASATSLDSRTSDSNTTGALVSKKNAYVYNWIKQEDAKRKAKEFINNNNVKSGLITGIQWDMVMEFLNRKERKDGMGEEYVVTKVSNPNTNRHHSDVERTGQNEYDKVCNIYDLEGNCREFAAEKNSSIYPYIVRGGRCTVYDSAATRCHCDGTVVDVYAFRFVLYVI